MKLIHLYKQKSLKSTFCFDSNMFKEPYKDLSLLYIWGEKTKFCMNSDLCVLYISVCMYKCVLAGPKGVINDWRKYKQLETEQRVEQQKEMERLIKKLSMTCRSQLDEELDKQKQKELQDKINGKVRCCL